MTEEEWWQSVGLVSMVRFSQEVGSGRRWRLAGVAFARALPFGFDPFVCEALDSSEAFADGCITQQAMSLIHSRLKQSIRFGPDQSSEEHRRNWFMRQIAPIARPTRRVELLRSSVWSFLTWQDWPEAIPSGMVFRPEWYERRAWRCRLFRCLFGWIPFRPWPTGPICVDPTARSLAVAIYEERAFDRLPVLADAMEEAGYHDAAVLDHCRGPGPHARGCWAVDLVLGRE